MQPETPDRDTAEGVAIFGAQVEAEVDRSPTLRYLVKNADDAERAAILGLGRVNPFKPEDIAPLQTKLAAARMVREWIEAAIVAGRNATALLASEDGQPLGGERVDE